MLKDIMAGQNLSEKVNLSFGIMAGKFWIIALTSSFKDFLDLMKTQFGDKTREEMEAMLRSGMSMEQVGVKCSLSHIEEETEQKTIKLMSRCLGHVKTDRKKNISHFQFCQFFVLKYNIGPGTFPTGS